MTLSQAKQIMKTAHSQEANLFLSHPVLYIQSKTPLQQDLWNYLEESLHIRMYAITFPTIPSKELNYKNLLNFYFPADIWWP